MQKIIGNKMDNLHANWKSCVILIIKLADEKKKTLFHYAHEEAPALISCKV